MSNLIEEIYKSGRNPSAMADSISYMDETTFQKCGLFDEWTEVKCQDGLKALVLKNPSKAFDIYAKEWSSKFNGLVDVANQVKIDASSEVNYKSSKII